MPVIREIQGRSAEVVCTPTGKTVSGVALSGHLCRHGRFADVIRQFQLIQESSHRACLLVVPSPDASEERLVRLKEHVEALLTGMDVTVESVSQVIGDRSGKTPLVKVAAGCRAQVLTPP